MDNEIDTLSVDALRARVAELEAQLAAGAFGEPRLHDVLMAEAERTASVGSWSWDPATNAIAWSKECFRLLGYEPGVDVPSAAAFFARIHPDDLPRIQAESGQVAAGELTMSKGRILHPQMGELHMRFGSTIVQSPGGGVQIVGTVQDVTASTRTREAEQRTAQQLEAAQRTAGLGSWVWDLERGALTSLSRFCSVLGMPEDWKPTADAFREHVRADDLPALASRLEKISAGAREIEPVEYRFAPNQGAPRYIRSTVHANIDDHGRLVGYVGIIMDVTEFKALEAQLVQSQKMDAIGALAGGVAHDFNNYLQVMVASAEALQEGLGGAPDLATYVSQIQDATGRCRLLIRRLLAFARNDVRLPKRTDLTKLAMDVSRLLGPIIGDQLDLQFDLPDSPSWVIVDPSEFEQVIVNLVLNARDAIGASGTITVRLSDSTPSAVAGRAERPSICLSVTDDGCGMSPDVLGRVFEPFFTTKVAARGTGLGLATARRIVEQDGGRISIESALGRGTSVAVCMPALSLPQDPTLETPAIPATAPMILLVEDDLRVQSITRRQLERAGYTIETADNGVEALERLDHISSPDLVLSDVMMPEMGGFALAKALAIRSPSLPVLFMSGFAGSDLRDNGLDMANIPLLQKPFSRDSLLKAVRRALASD